MIFKMLNDFQMFCKAVIHTSALVAVWYMLEFAQFNTLQWDRACDDAVIAIMFFVMWYNYAKVKYLKQEIENLRR